MGKSVATRKDIDEVLSVLNVFMIRMDERFKNIESTLDDYTQSFERLLVIVDDFIAGTPK